MWYRLTFDGAHAGTGNTLLHFGAVDWQTTVYLNGQLLGNHTGGYDGFDFDITGKLREAGNELLVYVFDPSDSGAQPNGKQRISAIDSPGGDTYTPSSGIWQTVWLEAVPAAYIEGLKIDQASTTAVTVTATATAAGPVKYEVVDKAGKTVATASGASGAAVGITVPGARTWSPSDPYLYDLKVSAGADTVLSYFGLRTFALGDGPKGKRPLLNGNFTFLAGFLDQSWWPDGQYTAPTDEGLAYDVEAVPMFGLNMIRLHQKVNPERWYWHADRLGVVVFQDAVQKYGHASDATIPFFKSDMTAMITGRGNHPCIVQFETFNEADCWSVFKTAPNDVQGIVSLAKRLAPHRLIDTDSGGGANNLHIADVNDIHSYPQPGDPQPSDSQYAMVGEFGGIGAFVEGKEWKPKSCHTYLHVDTPANEASSYIKMAASIQSRVDHVSASVYTQTTDVELECDGFLNYDRSNKFSDSDTAAIAKANQAIIQAAAELDQPAVVAAA
jgi:beta-galactosidase/beta-glucuronidase